MEYSRIPFGHSGCNKPSDILYPGTGFGTGYSISLCNLIRILFTGNFDSLLLFRLWTPAREKRRSKKPTHQRYSRRSKLIFTSKTAPIFSSSKDISKEKSWQVQVQAQGRFYFMTHLISQHTTKIYSQRAKASRHHRMSSME